MLSGQQFLEESPLRKKLHSLHLDIERADEETVRISETLVEYKFTFESRNARIASLEQCIQQTETEKIILKQQLEKVSQAVIVKKDPLISKTF